MATVDPDEHLEFEQLAVQHVLGGLDQTASSRFRQHLGDCPDCRQRVVELRGIAADLESAARDERALARVKLETVRRDPAPADDLDRPRPPHLVRTAILLLAAASLLMLAFWNVHLQSVRTALAASLDERGAVIDTLVGGELVPVDVRVEGLRALVAVDGRTIALNARGVPPLAADQRVVLWGLDPDGLQTRLAVLGPSGAPDGRAVLHVTGVSAASLVLTLETLPVGEGATGRVLLTAAIR